MNNFRKNHGQSAHAHSWFTVGQNIDRDFRATQENDFTKAIIQAADADGHATDDGMRGWYRRDDRSRQTVENTTHTADERRFHSEAARAQFHWQFKTPASAQTLRPTRTAPPRDHFTLRRDAIDLDFEDVVDAQDYSSAYAAPHAGSRPGYTASGLRKVKAPPLLFPSSDQDGGDDGGDGGFGGAERRDPSR